MRLVGMMMCRNEDWCLDLSARAALIWCDALVILNHRSTDRTTEIALDLSREFPGRIGYTHAPQSDWHEMVYRQAMLEYARELAATHLAIIDADEVLTGNLLESIRVHIESMAPGRILQLPGYNLRGGLYRYHSTGIWADRWFSVAFKDDARLNWRGDHFHQREPGGMVMPWSRPIMQGQGGVMHLWGADGRRLVAKHALYKMTETLRWPAKSKREIDDLYSLAFDPTLNRMFDQNWRYAEVPEEWWAPYGVPWNRVKLDAVPWQEAECRRLYAEHGPDRFAGLNLFDVCATEAVTK